MGMQLAVVNQIEKNITMLEFENRTLMELPARFLPAGAGEGAAIRVSLEFDPEATERFRREAEDLQRQLRERGPQRGN